MPHLTKNVVTCLKLLSISISKWKLRMGQVPINIGMIEDVWLKSSGASVQLQATKLTSNHFVKNAYSWMNVSLTTQLLLASTTAMIQNAIDHNENVLNLCEKLCMNTFVIFAHTGTAWWISVMDKTDRTVWRMQLSCRHNFCRL
jgi:hypothetical protein